MLSKIETNLKKEYDTRKSTASVVIFFCITQLSQTASTLGSGMPCAARTFLFRHIGAYSDRLSDCFLSTKLGIISIKSKSFTSFLCVCLLYFFLMAMFCFLLVIRNAAMILPRSHGSIYLFV